MEPAESRTPSGIGHRAISPSTPVSATLAKTVVIAGSLVMATISATTAVLVLKAQIAAVDRRVTEHIEDTAVHLDKTYYRAHGDVIGKFDLNIAAATISASVDELRKSVNELNTEIHQKKVR